LTTKPAAPAQSKRQRPAARSQIVKPRAAANGDIAPVHSSRGVESFTVNEAVGAAQESKVVAVNDILKQAGNGSPEVIESLKAILAGASPEDAAVLRSALVSKPSPGESGVSADPDS